jgi:hypothetical protein
VRVTAQNIGLAMPHKLQLSDVRTDRCDEKFQECCGPRYSDIEYAASGPLQYPMLEGRAHFLDVPKGK